MTSEVLFLLNLLRRMPKKEISETLRNFKVRFGIWDRERQKVIKSYATGAVK